MLSECFNWYQHILIQSRLISPLRQNKDSFNLFQLWRQHEYVSTCHCLLKRLWAARIQIRTYLELFREQALPIQADQQGHQEQDDFWPQEGRGHQKAGWGDQEREGADQEVGGGEQEEDGEAGATREGGEWKKEKRKITSFLYGRQSNVVLDDLQLLWRSLLSPVF